MKIIAYLCCKSVLVACALGKLLGCPSISFYIFNVAGATPVTPTVREAPLRMKDPIGLLLPVVMTAWGTGALFFPQWFYRRSRPGKRHETESDSKNVGWPSSRPGLFCSGSGFIGGAKYGYIL